MALYRCASCGSPNVITDTQTSGISYNYKKGAIGTVVLGAGGAVAGIENKTGTVYVCPDCGVTLSYTMSQDLKNAIDLALVSEEYRDRMRVERTGLVNWDLLKKQYRNIEEGYVDRAIARRASIQQETLLSFATATQQEFDSAVDLIVEYKNRLYRRDEAINEHFTDEHPMTLVEYYEFQNAVSVLIENMAKFLPFPLPDEYRGLSRNVITSFFLMYLFEKVRLDKGRYPDFQDYKWWVSQEDLEKMRDKKYHYCTAFYLYADNHPFVLHFANKYFEDKGRNIPGWGTPHEEWTPESFACISKGGTFINTNDIFKSCPFFEKRWLERFDENGEEIKAPKFYGPYYYFTPKYIVKHGKLAYWYGSHKIVRENEIIEDYFTHYPEKRAIYNAKIAELQTMLQTNEQMENDIKSFEATIKQNKETIKAKQPEIAQLQKKIFGKKKALARINEINEEIKSLEEKNKELSEHINSHKKDLKTNDPASFLLQLYKDMDYFVHWKYVDDLELN